MGRIINAYGDHDDHNDDHDGDDNDNDDNDVNGDGDFDEGEGEQIALKVEGCLQVLADNSTNCINLPITNQIILIIKMRMMKVVQL